MTIHVQIDKSELIEAAQAAQTEGKKFADQVIKILVLDWEADPQGIDKIAALEGATGHLIDCCIRGVGPTPYKEYVSGILAMYSDRGLAKMGLTRKQYQAARQARFEHGYPKGAKP